jgi:tetratricopeptide (TPR) repeat protein
VVEIDSTFAEAWASYSARASYSAQYGHVPRDEGYNLARTAAERAIALDPTLAAAHMAMATVLWHQDWDWEGSLQATERAAALNPMGTGGRNSRAWRLFAMGRVDEGIELYEQIIALAPLNPDLRQVLGWHLGNIGRYELAIEHFEKNLELFPDHYFSNMLLALSYSAVGEYEKAVAHRKKMEQMFEFLRVDADGDGVPEKGIGPTYSRGGGSLLLWKAYANSSARGELVDAKEGAKAKYEEDPSGRNAWLAAAYLIPLGETDEAREWLELSAESIWANVQDGTPRAAEEVLNQAHLYSSIGEKDLAFEWLDLAFELRAASLVDLYRKHYRFKELWGDPRYAELMRRRGFPEEVVRNFQR